jgi:S1-C subfamily serine protease
MRWRYCVGFVFCILLSCRAVQPPPQPVPPAPPPIPKPPDQPVRPREAVLLEEADYLALIIVKFREKNEIVGSLAAGFLWKSPEERYFVVSANHIIPKEGVPNILEIKVGFYKHVKDKTRKIYTASVFNHANSHDVCLLTINEQDFKWEGKTAGFGSSSTIQKGDVVYALGHPVQIPWTVSKGKVLYPRVKIFDRPLGVLLICHNAWGWYGSSGGPLLNENGEVIGMNILGVGLSEGRVDAILAVPSDDLIDLFYKWTKNY